MFQTGSPTLRHCYEFIPQNAPNHERCTAWLCWGPGCPSVASALFIRSYSCFGSDEALESGLNNDSDFTVETEAKLPHGLHQPSESAPSSWVT